MFLDLEEARHVVPMRSLAVRTIRHLRNSQTLVVNFDATQLASGPARRGVLRVAAPMELVVIILHERPHGTWI